jgi:hypothetical protein
VEENLDAAWPNGARMVGTAGTWAWSRAAPPLRKRTPGIA